MTKTILLIIAALTFIGCEEISGKLDIRKPFNLKAKKGKLVLKEGTIGAKLDFTNKRTAYLKAKGKKVKIKLNKGLKFPKNGDFNFNSSQTNLDLDLSGDARRDVNHGPSRIGYEDCSRSYPVTRCNRRGVCRTTYVHRPGTRVNTYRINTIDEELRINIEKDQELLAVFDAARTYTRREILDHGFCNIGHRRF